ncbi:hypothetical protein AE1304_16280 [Aeromonas enteropelogenes]
MDSSKKRYIGALSTDQAWTPASEDDRHDNFSIINRDLAQDLVSNGKNAWLRKKNASRRAGV